MCLNFRQSYQKRIGSSYYFIPVKGVQINGQFRPQKYDLHQCFMLIKYDLISPH